MSAASNTILAEIVRAARAFILRRLEDDAIRLRPNKPRVRGPLTSLAKDVLRTLTFRFANALTGLCHPSLATIAGAAGCSESSVKRLLPALRDAGYVEWRPGPWKRLLTRKGWRMVRSANRYHLTCPGQYLAELHAWLTKVFRGKHGHLIKLVVSRFTPHSAEANEETQETAREAATSGDTVSGTLAQDLRPTQPQTAPPPAPTRRDTDPPSHGPPEPSGDAEIGGVQITDPSLRTALSGLWKALEQREQDGHRPG